MLSSFSDQEQFMEAFVISGPLSRPPKQVICRPPQGTADSGYSDLGSSKWEPQLCAQVKGCL